MIVNPLPSSTAPLVLRLFGPFQVWVEGRPLPRLRSRKGERLLALLALHHEVSVERCWVAGTLWPESPEPQGLASLRKSLYDLRRALGPAAECLCSPTPRTLRLDLEGADVDLVTFAAAMARGDPASLEQAITLYQGLLLDGCEEEWVFQERQVCEETYVTALEALAAEATARHDHAAAECYLRRAVATDPLRESAQRDLMQALSVSGNHAAAVQVYRDLRLLLHHRLSAEPDPETTTLFHQLRAEARCAAARPSASGQGMPAETPRGPDRTEPPEAVRSLSVAERSPRLPQPLTTLVGRESDTAQVKAALAASRLVTLTGSGGVGKTRLAIRVAEEVAEQFPDGVWFVDLAPLAEGALVAKSVAALLQVSEKPERPVVETLVDALRSKHLLLILDNCEHLVQACALLVDTLLAACPHLRILATSRQLLGITGERGWRVPSLSLPQESVGFWGSGSGIEQASPDALMEYGAIRLFIERARDAVPNFALDPQNARAIIQICRRLDGIPLAMELAAARLKHLPVEQIAARLDDCFRLLTTGSRAALPRHQTLRGAIDWSYNLLPEAERMLLCRLSVFAGGFTLEAAETIGSDSVLPDGPPSIQNQEILDLLGNLIDKSLVLPEHRGEGTRYRLLETVRQYAGERLREGREAERVRERHRDYFLALAEAAADELDGPQQAQWLERLETELGNLRAALAWSESRGDPDIDLRLTGALWRFWFVRGHQSEGRAWLVGALARGAESDPALRARALTGAAHLTRHQGDVQSARRFLAEGLAIYRALEDRRGIAGALNDLSRLAAFQGDYPAARALGEEALATSRESCDRAWEAHMLGNLGLLAGLQGDYRAARAFFRQNLEIHRKRGNRGGIAGTLNDLGEIARSEGDDAAAQALYEEALAINLEIGNRAWAALNLNNLGEVALDQGDCATARSMCEQSLAILRPSGMKRGMARSLNSLAEVSYREGDYPAARAFLEESLTIRRELRDSRGLAESLETGMGFSVAEGDFHRAARLFGAAERLRAVVGAPLPPARCEAYAARLEAVRAALGESGFARAWAEGRALPLEQATACAVATLPPVSEGRIGKRHLPHPVGQLE